jgi:hypothetical protein
MKEWDGRVREVLSDLETDPGKMVSLAKERRFASQLQMGRQSLGQWYRENGESLDQGYVV